MKSLIRRAFGLTGRKGQHSLILMYHRIADEPRDPLRVTVHPAHFDDQLATLKRDWNVLPLSELARLHRDGSLPPRSVAITFDDGYACNLNIAAPILDNHRLPATFFLITGALDSATEYWWDEVEALLFGAFFTGTHSVQIGQQKIEFELEKTAPTKSDWSVYRTATTGRQKAFKVIAKALQEATAGEQKRVLDSLWHMAGTARPPVRATRRVMTTAEAVALSRRPGMEIGAHTVTHPMLGLHPAEVQRTEIETSKSVCDKAFHQSTRSFAYANGSFNGSAMEIARQAGFDIACTSEARPVSPEMDLMAMPRVAVLDLAGRAFADSLERVSARM